MRVLVVGLGSIGRRHIKNLKTIEPDIQISVWRQHSKKEELGELEPLVESVLFDRNDALGWKPEVTLITNPAPFHIRDALSFARLGSHLFIEKPLSVNLDDIDILLQECSQRALVLTVGYVLRFFESLRILRQTIQEGRIGRVLYIHSAAGQYLPDWRPNKDYRDSVSANKKLGGGAVFELSHELDYVCWLIGEVTAVSAQMGKLSNLEIDVEDVAEIFLRFDSGAIGNVHLDMVDRAKNRLCRVVGTEGTLIWDASDSGQSVRLYTAENKSWSDLLSTNSSDINEFYKAQLRHFFDCVRNKKKPLVSGVDGRRVVEIALAAKRSAENGEVITL